MINLKNKLKGILAALLLFSVIYIPLDHNTKPITYYYEPQISTNNTSAVKSDRFTVKEHNGKIAVFESDNTNPLYVLDSPFIRDLPPADQELLKIGIKADTKEELLKILEDYDN